mmetsp:Transcript_22656/g.57993  ORF Transcript_22656/g.57993 Transcript_22656/m.57993 type:complete len:153 (-) Transcript_22656:275-733(-)
MGVPQYTIDERRSRAKHNVRERSRSPPRPETTAPSQRLDETQFRGRPASRGGDELSPRATSGTGLLSHEASSRDELRNTRQNKPQPNDEVVLLVDLPWQNLWRGSVGIVASAHRPDKVDVEFTDRDSGDSYQFLSIPTEQLLVLLHNQLPEG